MLAADFSKHPVHAEVHISTLKKKKQGGNKIVPPEVLYSVLAGNECK